MHASRFALGFTLLAAVACSAKNSVTSSNDGGTSATCASPPMVSGNAYCKSCVPSATRTPAACIDARPIDACCAWVQSPTQEVARGTNLHVSSSTDPTVNLDCLAAPKAQGVSKMVTLKGFVKLFSSGGDSAGVKIEAFKEGIDGALGAPVSSPFVTLNNDTMDPPQLPLPDWAPNKCGNGCKLRSYTLTNVPTETPLILKTSDAAATGQWADLYDYNIYLSNDALEAGDIGHYDASTVAATDINTVALAAGGLTIKPDRGVIAGEVHDCGDVRLSGAMVDSDLAHEGPAFYFGENEADPLPDQSRAPQGLGTSKLGLFSALNFATGVPIRLSAVGKFKGDTVLLGSHTVQAFPGAVTALSFRGRAPWQK
jgi:hypothetical protein